MSPLSKNDDLYRPCVGIMLLNKSHSIFVGQRKKTSSSTWQMPQGGIDQGESPQEALWRELKEEVGTDQASLLEEYPGWLYYDLPSELQGTLWGGHYIGQRQKWFALRFSAEENNINIFSDENPEFCAWSWMSSEELLDRVVPFKREVYKAVFQGFKHLLFPSLSL